MRYSVLQRKYSLLLTLDLQLIKFPYLRTFVIMQQDVVVIESLFAHDGGTYLAQAYAVSPSGSGQLEPYGRSVGVFAFIDHKSRTEQVGGREGTPYLQFLADNQRLFRTYDFQFADASRLSPLYGDEVEYLSVIVLGFGAD